MRPDRWSGKTGEVNLNDVPVPTTPAAEAALEVAKHYCSPAFVNHCLRSYVWSASYGMRFDVSFDAELLYVSAMLHDIGLAKDFDNHTIPFEDAGGHVAWVLGAGAGWPIERRARSSEIIIRHMWDRVDPALDPEGHLLSVGTTLDISGKNWEKWPEEFRAEVLARLPRFDLGSQFLRCLENQARRKPASSAAEAIRSGLADRIATNVLDR